MLEVKKIDQCETLGRRTRRVHCPKGRKIDWDPIGFHNFNFLGSYKSDICSFFSGTHVAVIKNLLFTKVCYKISTYTLETNRDVTFMFLVFKLKCDFYLKGYTVLPTSVLTKASVLYEIRVLWANLNHVKSHAMALVLSLQTDMNQIFQMRYCKPW